MACHCKLSTHIGQACVPKQRVWPTNTHTGCNVVSACVCCLDCSQSGGSLNRYTAVCVLLLNGWGLSSIHTHTDGTQWTAHICRYFAKRVHISTANIHTQHLWTGAFACDLNKRRSNLLLRNWFALWLKLWNKAGTQNRYAYKCCAWDLD